MIILITNTSYHLKDSSPKELKIHISFSNRILRKGRIKNRTYSATFCGRRNVCTLHIFFWGEGRLMSELLSQTEKSE